MGIRRPAAEAGGGDVNDLLVAFLFLSGVFALVLLGNVAVRLTTCWLDKVDPPRQRKCTTCRVQDELWHISPAITRPRRRFRRSEAKP